MSDALGEAFRSSKGASFVPFNLFAGGWVRQIRFASPFPFVSAHFPSSSRERVLSPPLFLPPNDRRNNLVFPPPTVDFPPPSCPYPYFSSQSRKYRLTSQTTKKERKNKEKQIRYKTFHFSTFEFYEFHYEKNFWFGLLPLFIFLSFFPGKNNSNLSFQPFLSPFPL